MKKIAFFVLFFSCFIIPKNTGLFAAEVEKLQPAETRIEEEKLLREKIEKAPEKPKVEEEAPAPRPAPGPSEKKVLIKTITVTGVTLLPEKDIEDIVSEYQNKELYLKEMQELADRITDAYRKKGYITSRAYLPPQKIESGILEVRVIEGVTGDIEVKGNRYFKTALYKKYVTLKKNEPFNYDNLRKGLSRINELPDRNARAVLAPGKSAGSTDVVLEVEDRFPIHAGLDYDNYGSRYIKKNRVRTTLTHNNLLGWDDALTLQYQLAEKEDYRLLSARYLLPVTQGLKLGFFAAKSKLRLGKEFEDLNARGKSTIYSVYAIQSLVDKENISVSLNAGFDYKDVFNFQVGQEISRDRLRIAKAGFDFDATDKWGRTFISNEVDVGIPDIMGGLEKEDPRSSRSDGGGGKFVKDVLNVLRLQKMPFSSTILWKNQFQFTSDILVATEQFQIGGISNVRGYPPAEVVGDRGYSMTWEWSFPVYLIPKNIKVPFSKAKFYDAIRFVGFYDWANTHLIRTQPGEEKDKTLRSAGCGIRFNLPEDFSMRAEVAWPLDNKPSDGKNMQTWLELSKTF